MCKHSNLFIDQILPIIYEGGVCSICKKSAAKCEVMAQYVGHREVNSQIEDVFWLVDEVRCPHCNVLIQTVSVNCDEPPVYLLISAEDIAELSNENLD